MFQLSDSDMSKRIAGFGDEPASFKIVKTDYEFQKGDNNLLIIRK